MSKIIILSTLVLTFGFVGANTESIICKKITPAVRRILRADEILCGRENGLILTTNERNVNGVILGSLNMSYYIISLNLWIGIKTNEIPTLNLVSNITMPFGNRVLRIIQLRPAHGNITIFVGGSNAMFNESVSGKFTVISDRTMPYILQHNGTRINL
ncbi:uncharacterized protein LOC135927673 isoform X3 [Gordionus sp. m RMFG-2023]|uniref:uncharacterized protein LOC135927673 isoform X3 n=1 Tax=Gordionus sp. m RMFG-2023 TaxID=3053472 RepID=UPI0031FC6C34